MWCTRLNVPYKRVCLRVHCARICVCVRLFCVLCEAVYPYP